MAAEGAEQEMKCTKVHEFTAFGGETATVRCIELLSDACTMFVWPSAVLMGCLLTYMRDELRGGAVLEIGAGVGLPAVLASMYGASKVVACERPDVPAAVENLAGNLEENCPVQVQSGSCLAIGYAWGSELPEAMTRVDFLLGADVFYSSEAFDSVLATYAMCLERTPSCVFYTVYQQRSHTRTLVPYLQRWNMQVETISTSAVLENVSTTNEAMLFEQELFLLKITPR